MQQETGRFVTEKEMREKWGKDWTPDSPMFQKMSNMPTLEIGEIVEIKGVKFRVTRIKSNGKLGLKMLAIPAAA